MPNTTGWHNVAAYFQQALNESGQPLSTFAKAWGTNPKTLTKILAGEAPRSDAQQHIREARGWPVDAFDRLRKGQLPSPEVPDDIGDRVSSIEERLQRIEAHIGMSGTPGRRLRAAKGGKADPGASSSTGSRTKPKR